MQTEDKKVKVLRLGRSSSQLFIAVHTTSQLYIEERVREAFVDQRNADAFAGWAVLRLPFRVVSSDSLSGYLRSSRVRSRLECLSPDERNEK